MADEEPIIVPSNNEVLGSTEPMIIPLDVARTRSGDFQNSRIAEMNSVMRMKVFGDNPVNTYQQTVLATDNKEMLTKSTTDVYQTKLGDIESSIINQIQSFNPLVSPDAAPIDPSDLQDFQGVYSDISRESEDPMRTEIALSTAVEDTSKPYIDWKSSANQATFQLYARNYINEYLDSRGKLDTFADYTGLILPLNGLSWDIDNFLEETGKGGLLNFDANDFQDFVHKFHSLSDEEKVRVFPGIFDAIKKATSTTILGIDISTENSVKAAQIALQLLNPDGEEAKKLVLREGAWAALDIGLLAPIGAAGKLGKAAEAAGTVSQAQVNLEQAAKAVAAATELLAAENTGVKWTARGNYDQAASINLFTLQDNTGLMSKAINTGQHTAYSNTLPWAETMYQWDKKITPGLAPASTKNLNDFVRLSEGLKNSVSERSTMINEGILRPSVERYRIEKELDVLKNESDFYNEQLQIDNIKVVNQTGNSATFEYKINGADGSSKTKTVKWNLDDVGDLTEGFEETPGEVVRWLTSPRQWAKGAFNEVSQQAISLDYLSSNYRKAFTDFVTEAVKTPSGRVLSRTEQERLSSVLIAGDEYINSASAIRGKVFTETELRAGIPTADGRKIVLTEDEIVGYKKMRQAYDVFHDVLNDTTRRGLELQGYKSISVQERPVLVRPFEELKSAQASLRQTEANRAYNAVTNEFVDLTDDAVKQLYNENKIITKIRGDHSFDPNTKGMIGKEFVDYAIIDKTAVKELPINIINKKPGYVPKLNKDVRYLAVASDEVMKNGRRISKQSVQRFFSNKADADAFVKQLNDKAKASGNPEKYAVKKDREATPEDMFDAQMDSYGGLYTGPRSSMDIKYGATGIPAERANAFEALLRNAQHLSKFVARNDWRLGREQEWVNTVSKLMTRGVIPRTEINGFQTKLIGGSKEVKALEAMRTQIKIWNSIPTKEEHFFESVAQGVHDYSLGILRKAGVKKEKISPLLSLAQVDLASSVRGASFHLMLGAFNPAQLLVQAMGAAVAVSRYPLSAPKALFDTISFALLDNIKDAGWKASTMKKLGVNPKKYDAWIRSGYAAEITQSADYKAVENSIMTPSYMGKFLDRGLTFYWGGELFNRRLSFLSSYANLVKEGTSVTDDVIKQVIKDAELSRLELSKANSAMWQGGMDANAFEQILGVAAQFKQVTAKAAELMFLRGQKQGGFSTQEKVQILLGQTALFGMAGIPFGVSLTEGVKRLTGVQNTDLSPIMQEFINGGAAESIPYMVWGIDADIAKRASITGDLGKMIGDMLTSDASVSQVLLGASSTTGTRLSNAINSIKPYVVSAMADGNLTRTDLVVGLTEVAKITSTGNNAWKAYMMYETGNVIDANGNIAMTMDKNNSAQIIAQALGFAPSRARELRDIMGSNRLRNEAVNDAVKIALKAYYNYDIIGKNDPEAGKRLSSVISTISSSFASNPQMAEDFRKQLANRINNPTNKEERAVKDYIENNLGKQFEDAVYDSFFDVLYKQERALVNPTPVQQRQTEK